MVLIFLLVLQRETRRNSTKTLGFAVLEPAPNPIGCCGDFCNLWESPLLSPLCSQKVGEKTRFSGKAGSSRCQAKGFGGRGLAAGLKDRDGMGHTSPVSLLQHHTRGAAAPSHQVPLFHNGR